MCLCEYESRIACRGRRPRDAHSCAPEAANVPATRAARGQRCVWVATCRRAGGGWRASAGTKERGLWHRVVVPRLQADAATCSGDSRWRWPARCSAGTSWRADRRRLVRPRRGRYPARRRYARRLPWQLLAGAFDEQRWRLDVEWRRDVLVEATRESPADGRRAG